MPAITIAVPKIATDPGYLFHAPLGTAAPTSTVVGSVFTDAWPSEWVALGATDEGHAFNWQTSTEAVEAAEFLDPLAYKETGRTGSVAFALVSITLQNLRRALNGGTVATTGTTTTTKTTYTPPGLGQSVRSMIGWESQDSTERLICYQVFNTGSVEIARRKGAARATIPVEFSIEVGANGKPWDYITAGVDRAGA